MNEATIPLTNELNHLPPPGGNSLAAVMHEATAKTRSPFDELLALIPVDKQAEASSLVLRLLQEARETGEPRDPRKSKLSIGKGNRYRRAEFIKAASA
jgi:hypothetical protein